MVLGSVDSGALVRQNIMVAGMCGGFVCSPPGRQEAEREGGRDHMPGIIFKGMSPVTHVL
jgi:hypothetical protein